MLIKPFTVYCIFTQSSGSRRIDFTISYYNGISISMAQCVKYLGVYIDEYLKWSEHIKYLYI